MDDRMFSHQAGRGISHVLQQELGLTLGIHYTVKGYNSNRTLTLSLIGIGPTHLDKLYKLTNKMTMAAGLSNDRRIRIGYANYFVNLELSKPPELWKPVTIDGMMSKGFLTNGHHATIGLDTQDKPTVINFGDGITSSVAISGETGSGKSQTMRGLLWNIARNMLPNEGRVLILDPSKKGQDWQEFSNISHLLHPLVTDFNEARQVVTWLEREYRSRTEAGQTIPRIFVFVDELRDLCRQNEDVLKRLNLVASLGRSFGMHIVWATQYPKIKQLGAIADELKDNSNVKLIGRVSSATNAVNASGIPDTGAEMLTGRGDYYLRRPEVDGLTRLVVAMVLPHHLTMLDRVDSVPHLDLPPLEDANDAVSGTKQPAEITPEQVAWAFFSQKGIGQIANRFGIGKSRATRVRNFAQAMTSQAHKFGFIDQQRFFNQFKEVNV